MLGLWVAPDGKSRVLIYRVADGDYYGRIVWLKQPDHPPDYAEGSPAGRPEPNRSNPEEGLSRHPPSELNVLAGFGYRRKDGDWSGGRCYDLRDGKTYACRMWLTEGGRKLELRDYSWIFYETRTWTRYRASPAASASSAATR